MFICEHCGKLVGEEDVSFVIEQTFSPFDSNYKRYLKENCECGGFFEEAKKCFGCGTWITEEHDLCEDCINKYKNIDTMLEIGSDWEEQVELNGFLLSFYSKEDIEQILIDSLRNEEDHKLRRAIERYYEADKINFEEYEKDKRRRLGDEACRPHRIKYKKLER